MPDPTTSRRDGRVASIFLSKGLSYVVVTAVQVLAAALSYPLLSRLVEPQDLGAIAVGLVVYKLLSMVAPLGLGAAVTREYFAGADGPELARQLATASAVVSTLVVAVVLLLGDAWSALFAGVQFGALLALAVVASLAAAVAHLSLAVARAADDVTGFARVTIAMGPVAQLLGVAAVAVTTRPWTYFVGLSLGGVVAVAVGARRGAFGPLLPVDRDALRAAFRLGSPTLFHLAGVQLLAVGDRVVIERLLGLEAMGRYELAYVVGALAVAAVGAFNNGWAPLVLGATETARWRVLAETRRAIEPLIGFGALAVAAGAPYVLAVIAPEAYDMVGLAPVTVLVTCSAFPYLVYVAESFVMYESRATMVFAFAAPLAATANILLNIWLIPRYGLVGSAVATLTSYVLLAAIVALRARRLVTLGHAPLGAAAAISLAAVAGVSWLPVDGPGAFVRSVVLVGALGGLAMLLRKVR